MRKLNQQGVGSTVFTLYRELDEYQVRVVVDGVSVPVRTHYAGDLDDAEATMQAMMQEELAAQAALQAGIMAGRRKARDRIANEVYEEVAEMQWNSGWEDWTKFRLIELKNQLKYWAEDIQDRLDEIEKAREQTRGGTA